MPYSQSLAERVRWILRQQSAVVEKKMFGGLGFMLDGNLLVGVMHDSLIVRLGAEQAQHSLRQDHVREFDFTGRPMKNWIVVEPDGLDSDRLLEDWIAAAREFVQTLPPK